MRVKDKNYRKNVPDPRGDEESKHSDKESKSSEEDNEESRSTIKESDEVSDDLENSEGVKNTTYSHEILINREKQTDEL